MGARVIAVARGAEKRAVAAAAGAALTSRRRATTSRAAVKALGGADVVYDTVGGALFDACLRAAKPGARLLPIGFASGAVPQIPANRLLVKNLTVIGLYFGAWVARAPGGGARQPRDAVRLVPARAAAAARRPRAAARGGQRRARPAAQPRRHRQGGGAGRLSYSAASRSARR